MKQIHVAGAKRGKMRASKSQLVLVLLLMTELNNVEGSAGRNAGDRAGNLQPTGGLLWGFSVAKTMPMVKLCVEWLGILFAFLDSHVDILKFQFEQSSVSSVTG